MGDNGKYDLVSLDEKCVLTDKNINILLNSPDITSIITALDNNKNPSDLFLNQSSVLSNVINDQLSFINDNLDNIKVWFDRTLNPSLQVMSSENFKQCGPIVNSMIQKMQQIKRSTKKAMQNRPKHINHEITCPVCGKFFFLKNKSDWIEYEEHEHVAEMLSKGDFNRTNNENVTEPDKCIIKPAVEVKNVEPKIKPKQRINTLPLCLYASKIRDVLYPTEITSNICSIENNYNFYSVQAISAARFHCFLCRVDMYQNKCVYSHVSGQKHKNKLNDRNCVGTLMSYHSVFSNLPEEMQIHQVVFRPSFKLEFIYCKVCSLQIVYQDIAQHLTTNMHRIRMNARQFTKLNFFDEIVKSFGADTCSSDEDSSEISIPTQLIYNSANNEVKCLISKVKSLNLTDSQKNNESTDEDSEDESESAKSDKITAVPLQGTSKMISTDKENTPKSDKTIKHNIVPAFKEKMKDLFDELENRYQVYVDYIKTTKSGLQCLICIKNLAHDMKDIKNHLASNDHKKNAGAQFGNQKYTYYCDLCYRYCRNEAKWSEHLTCIEHGQRTEALMKSREPRGGPFKEYECTTCCLAFYGNNTTIKKHLNESFGVYKKSRKKKEIKLPPQLINLLRSEQLFAEEIFKLSKESNEVLKSIRLSWECCKGIERALEPVFGQCKAYPFGSRVSGLGNLGSDLDVFVDTGLMYEGMFNQDPESQTKLVNHTSRALRKHKEFTDVFAIPNARTPIVQVYHKITELDCDLSFRHGLSVENTEFLKLCINIQPLLKIVILFLKRWSHFCKLNDRISTYALSMLCVFYFQQIGLLPSVKELREIDPTESKVIAGWETFSFTKPLAELNILYPTCKIFIKDMLIAFFEFYTKFRFHMEVVCPLLGQPVLKSDFYQDKGKRLPLEMRAYVKRINESDENEVFRSMSPMCIQDPFDLSHNLTKACPVDFVNKFVILCQLSLATLGKKN